MQELPKTKQLRDGRKLVIRQATVYDAPGMINLVSQVAAEGVYLAAERAPWSEEQLQRIIGDMQGYSIILVAEVEGKIVGDSWLRRGGLRKTSHTATLGMSLLPGFRGMGIGRDLLQTAIDWAKGQGIEKVCLSVFSSNDRAIGLYRSWGFAEEGRLKGQYRLPEIGEVDEVMMGLFLM